MAGINCFTERFWDLSAAFVLEVITIYPWFVWQTNTAIYQDVFSCIPSDLIHTRYDAVLNLPLIPSLPVLTTIFPKYDSTQSCTQTKHGLLEGETWPYYYWFRNSTWEVRILSKWRYQENWSHGKIKGIEGASCFFPPGFHVQRRFKTCVQWEWVLCIFSSFSLGITCGVLNVTLFSFSFLVGWGASMLYINLFIHSYCNFVQQIKES